MATPYLDFENDVENTLQPGVAFNQLADAVDSAIAGNVTANFAADDDLTLTRAQWMTNVLVLTDTGPVLTTVVDVVLPAAFPTMLVVNETVQTLTLTNGGTDEVTLAAGASARISAGADGVLEDPSSSGGVVATVVAGTGISVDSTDPANPVVSTTGTGSGDVTGPASSTDNTLPRFDGTGGKTLQGSGVAVTDNNEISGYRGHLNQQTGTTYTLQASDSGKIVELTNAAAIALTADPALPAGFACTIIQGGAGVVTVASSGSGTVVNRQSQFKTAGANAMCAIYVRSNSGSDAVFVLGGDTAA